MKVAIKTLKKEKYEKFREDFDKELAIMVKLEHPNILNVLGYSRSSKLTHWSRVMHIHVGNIAIIGNTAYGVESI